MTGKDPLDQAYVHGESWYGDNRVELRLGAAVAAIDRANHEVRLAGGERIGYNDGGRGAIVICGEHGRVAIVLQDEDRSVLEVHVSRVQPRIAPAACLSFA